MYMPKPMLQNLHIPVKPSSGYSIDTQYALTSRKPSGFNLNQQSSFNSYLAESTPQSQYKLKVNMFPSGNSASMPNTPSMSQQGQKHWDQYSKFMNSSESTPKRADRVEATFQQQIASNGCNQQPFSAKILSTPTPTPIPTPTPREMESKERYPNLKMRIRELEIENRISVSINKVQLKQKITYIEEQQRGSTGSTAESMQKSESAVEERFKQLEERVKRQQRIIDSLQKDKRALIKENNSLKIQGMASFTNHQRSLTNTEKLLSNLNLRPKSRFSKDEQFDNLSPRFSETTESALTEEDLNKIRCLQLQQQF